jgi:hypothetical protein
MMDGRYGAIPVARGQSELSSHNKKMQKTRKNRVFLLPPTSDTPNPRFPLWIDRFGMAFAPFRQKTQRI